MTDTSGGEPAIAEVLTAINGLRVNGPEPVRALREDVVALGNRTHGLSTVCVGTWNSASDCSWTP